MPGKTSKELVGERLLAKVKLTSYRFPKSGHGTGEFAIVNLWPMEIYEGELPTDLDEDTITATGRMPHLTTSETYILQGVLVIDKQWGPQFQVEDIHLNYNMKDRDDQKAFFSFFMTERQAELLFAEYDNPVDLLENKRIADLTKIKGIGPATAMRMCRKYEDCKDNGRAYIELKNLDLTKYAIDKLVQRYGNVDIVVEKVKNNPYILIKEVRGYGWKKADAIALKQGLTRDCKERVQAYTRYFLETQIENNGNSWITVDDLLSNVALECAPVTNENLFAWVKEMMGAEEQLEKAMKDEIKFTEYPELFYERDGRKVSLFSIRLLEKKIAENLKRLKDAPSKTKFDRKECEKIIEEVEKEQGYTYTDEQKKAIWMILDNNVSILAGGAGCVDKDTEFFTGTEWKKISEYQEGDKVLIYHEDGTATLEEPSRYIKLPCDQLWLVKSDRSVNMCLSEEHQVYYMTSKGNLYHKSFQEVKEAHERTAYGFNGSFYTSFIADGPGIDLTDAEIKVMLAVIADGSFMPRKDNKPYCRFHIKKDKKKIELKKILEEAGIEYRTHESAAKGYLDFYCFAPRREKEFSDYWYQCSQRQLQLICDNVLQWDGTISANRMSFSANNKKNADFVQYAFTACGYRASVSSGDRTGKKYLTCGKQYTRKSAEYRVTITKQNMVTIASHPQYNRKVPIVPYPTLDGYKYCFTVSTHMWIMRRGGRIVVTGNCGKSTTLKPVVRILKDTYYKHVEQTALSGRASSLLGEITGLQGKTIHRLLGFIPDEERFAFNERNHIPADVIILDETSMVGGDLFLKLISAIEDGSKFIMVGDFKQLESIGECNVLKDCLSSGYIASTVLTQIHRQAAKSGIITQSIKASNGEQLVPNDFLGSEVRGELKDLKITCSFDQKLTQHNIIEEFMHLYNDLHIPVEQIQIVVSMRVRGDISCRALNEAIQSIVNGKPTFQEVFVDYMDNGMKYRVYYRPKDRIIIRKNNYHARTVSGKEVAIFNGNMGYIDDITHDGMIIKLKDQENVILEREEWNNIQLAYAITCHSIQGSSAPYVIVGLDYSCYAMFSKEWVYTALTRASKYCVLVTQPKAINQAVKISRVRIKQTWLKQDLYNFFLEEQKGDF